MVMLILVQQGDSMIKTLFIFLTTTLLTVSFMVNFAASSIKAKQGIKTYLLRR